MSSESVSKKFFNLLRRLLCFEIFTQGRQMALPEAGVMIWVRKLFVF
jgi:hypothetical protein